MKRPSTRCTQLPPSTGPNHPLVAIGRGMATGTTITKKCSSRNTAARHRLGVSCSDAVAPGLDCDPKHCGFSLFDTLFLVHER